MRTLLTELCTTIELALSSRSWTSFLVNKNLFQLGVISHLDYFIIKKEPSGFLSNWPPNFRWRNLPDLKMHLDDHALLFNDLHMCEFLANFESTLIP